MASLSGLAAALLAGAALCLTGGCSTVGYLAQSAGGHLRLMRSARPVPEVVADPATPAPLKARLQMSQQMRDFAVRELALPDNGSYRRYAALDRAAPVWNVVAAPELSLQLKTWCFPVVGCVGYRGYYAQADAQAFADTLKAQGLEVDVYPVPAYSTLGYLSWLGGDPLLSSFIGWPEGELARLIFHELAHQRVYAAGDTAFNESYATAVERLGGARWLAQPGHEAARAQDEAAAPRRAEFRALVQQARAELDALYRGPLDDAAKRQRKAALYAALRQRYAEIKATRWQGYAGYDAFFARADNATLGVQAAYTQWVPAFEALFAREGGDFKRFHAAVQALAGLPRDQRDATLRSWLPAAAP